MLPEVKVDVGGCGTGDVTHVVIIYLGRIKTLTDRCRLGHEARGLRHGEWAGAPSAASDGLVRNANARNAGAA